LNHRGLAINDRVALSKQRCHGLVLCSTHTHFLKRYILLG